MNESRAELSQKAPLSSTQESTGMIAGSGPSGRQLRRRTVAAIFGAMLIGWLALFGSSGSVERGPDPKHLGGDFVLFLSASRALASNANPYEQRELYRAERSYLATQRVRVPRFDPYMRVGSPPLVFWALGPLTRMSFSASVVAWVSAMELLCGLACVVGVAWLGWRRRVLPLLMFLAMPQTVYAAYYGNLDGLVLAGLVAGAVLARRFPLLAGCCLVLAFLKPQVALPAAALIMVFLAGSPARAWGGFAAGTAVGVLVTVLTTGAASIGWWLHALTDYSARLAVQPDIASLSGLYVYWASDTVRVALEGASLAVALAATAVVWIKLRSAPQTPLLGIAWLWIVWFLVTPFAHFHDEVVLLLPVLAVLGTDGEWIGTWPASVTLYALLLSIALFPTARAHTDLQSIALVLVAGCAAAQLRKHGNAQGTRSRRAADSVGVGA